MSVVLSATLVLVLAPSAVADSATTSPLTVRAPVSVAGAENVTVQDGALYVTETGLSDSLVLSADELEIEFEWEQGRSAGVPGNDGLIEDTVDQGSTNKTFSNATLSIRTSNDSVEVLAYPGSGSSTTQVSGKGQHEYSGVSGDYLTRVGMSPKRQETPDARSIGFWYQPESHWLSGRGGDEGSTEGNFSLFVNNATVAVREDGQVAWQNWTGYREESIGPAASEYERHLLQVHVTGGNLDVQADNQVRVLGEAPAIETTGVVSSPGAVGQLDTSESSFAFGGGALTLEGSGALMLSEPNDPGSPVRQMGLELDSRSSFEVDGGQRLESAAGAQATGSNGFRLFSWLSGLGLLALGAVGARSGVAGSLVERWRATRYTKWMTRGREVANAGDLDRAVGCFRRATRAEPDKGVAWYHLALTLYEDGRPREVLDALDEARKREAVVDELDFLELEAAAANKLGLRDRCREAVEKLAEGSEGMAASFARDLQLGPSELGPKLANRLGRGEDRRDREELPGYV